MKRFIEREDRSQVTLLPGCLDDYIGQDNPIRVVDAFVEELELMWLTGRLTPDFKTVADFRRDHSAGIRNVCRRFVAPCRDLKLFSQVIVAIDKLGTWSAHHCINSVRSVSH